MNKILTVKEKMGGGGVGKWEREKVHESILEKG